MNDMLLNLMHHMRWADALVADALDHPATNPDVIGLFAHIAAVEHLWYARIHERAPTVAVWPTLAATHADLFEEIARAATDASLARRVRYRNSAGREFDSSVEDIMTHVAMHGSHHRGQILQRLRASGREPPYVDFIQFMRRDQIR